jgi:hypothetical protein
MNKKFIAYARWPYEVCGDLLFGTTINNFEYREEAKQYCETLKEIGFEGKGKYFPEITWITEI